MSKNEQNAEFFVSVDGEIRLYCRWIDYEKREFFVENGQWSGIFDENGGIFIPSINKTRTNNESNSRKIHYFNIPSKDYNEKIKLAQRMLDDLNPEEKQ